MTTDEATKFAPIIKAYSEGKTIQFIGEDGKWHDFTCGDVVFADNPEEYRIKPEAKYRPFKDAQECWDEMQKHQPFGWAKLKVYGTLELIKAVDDTGLIIGSIDASFSQVLDKFIFADGKPFGIEEGGEQ